MLIVLFSSNCLALSNSDSIHFNSVKLISDTSQKKMLYFEQRGCIPCEKMQVGTFSDKSVISFYNTNFLCIKVHVENTNNELSDFYDIKYFPSFVFLDDHGKVYHKAIGFFTAEEFIEQGNIALTNFNSHISYKEQFDSGDNSPEFLYKYCYSLLFAREDFSIPMEKYFKTQSEQDLKESKNIQFIYDFMVDGINSKIAYSSREFIFVYTHKDLFYAKYDKEQVDNRILTIVYNEILTAIDKKDSTLFNKVIKELKKFDNSQAVRVIKRQDGSKMGTIRGIYLATTAKMEFYKAVGDNRNYNKSLSELNHKIWNNVSNLNNYASDLSFAEESEAALPYIKRSLKLKEGYDNHYIYATILRNLGLQKEALKQLKLAMKFTKKGSKEYQDTKKIIESWN